MKSIFLLSLAMVTSTVWALPLAPFNALSNSLKAQTTQATDSYDFSGIVKLSNCSGSLVIFNGMPMTANALVMTNGHCIQKPGGYLAAGEVWIDREVSRKMKVFDKAMHLHPITASKIAYATMTDTDLAFYELTQTYQEILDGTGILPLTLETSHPVIGLPIEIISGYWDRGWGCSIDSFIFKMEEGQWTWTDSIRYTSTCDTMGGTSGSPLTIKDTKSVIGINNTSNESGGVCTLNNPCEISQTGERHAEKGVRYGQQTYKVYSCLRPDFTFDLDKVGCELPR